MIVENLYKIFGAKPKKAIRLLKEGHGKASIFKKTRMNEGEKSQKGIERRVDEWIAKNTEKWNGWLEKARKAAM